jgi:hypothetical protein
LKKLLEERKMSKITSLYVEMIKEALKKRCLFCEVSTWTFVDARDDEIFIIEVSSDAQHRANYGIGKKRGGPIGIYKLVDRYEDIDSIEFPIDQSLITKNIVAALKAEESKIICPVCHDDDDILHCETCNSTGRVLPKS